MILLRADTELKAIFKKLINTMGIEFSWTEIFVINNNNLILTGRDHVLYFNFDNKMIGSNPADLNFKEDSVQQIKKNEILQNAINITLYTFGKWGKINGLTVEKDYSQLNGLFNNIFRKINVDPVLTTDKLSFYKDGILISYEDVIQIILDLMKQQEEEDNAKSEDNKSVWDELEKRKYNIGLWHKLIWTSERFQFVKERITESDKVKSRIGKNFYMVSYQCTVCKEKLSMVIYPMGKEQLIETDEKGVFLARAYACSTCHCFYTPKPHMLLSEGNVFYIGFEDDKQAYEDYLEVLGRQGERTSNCNYNEYEIDYRRKNRRNVPELEEICRDIDSMSEQELLKLQDKMDSGFFPVKSTDKFYETVASEILGRKNNTKKTKVKNENSHESERKQDTKRPDTSAAKHNDKLTDAAKQDTKLPDNAAKQDEKGLTAKSEHDYGISKEKRHSSEYRDKSGFCDAEYNTKPGYNDAEDNTKSEYYDTEYNKKNGYNKNSVGSDDHNKVGTAKQKDAADIGFAAYSPKKQGNAALDLPDDIPGMQSAEDKYSPYQELADGTSSDVWETAGYNARERELRHKVEDCKNQSYAGIVRVMEDMKKEDINDSTIQTFLSSLKALLEKRGMQELNAISLKIPENINKTQYNQYKEAIEQYKEIDYTTPMKLLDNKRDEAEKQEIKAYIKRANAKDRNDMLELHHRLEKEEFSEKNVAPFLENLQNKVYEFDEKTIKKICPDPAELSFDEGRRAYDEIASKELLPELKSKTLQMIDKRLTKLKMNECEQLVNKLAKDMGRVLPVNSRIHFYNVRKGMHENSGDEETQIIQKALNTYASERGKYEFPILICDASIKENGGRGFVLTPDHIFYNNILSSGVVDVMKIKNVIAHNGINSGIYSAMNPGGKIKISSQLKLHKLKPFVTVLNDFISYLKEKPESRDIAYLAKEKHRVKCCYRCGFVYQGDNICPRCGAKFNE